MTLPPYILVVVLLLGLSGCSEDPEPIAPNPPAAPSFAAEPQDIEIITDDITLFWQVYDDADGDYQNDFFMQNYFRAGSPELSLFFDAKIKDPARLTDKLSNSNYRNYYNSVRSNTESLASNLDGIRNALEALEHNYPAAVYSDLVLVIGAMGTGGTVVSNGSMVIGTEFFTRAPDTPITGLPHWIDMVTRDDSYLPSIVLHELVHVQQRNFVIQQNLSIKGTLLEVALAEGIADFVTELLLGIYFNDHLPLWADPREEELWLEFESEMNDTELSGWLFNANTVSGRPADLGYYLGYKIAEHFYDQQQDKTLALQELLEISDAQEFLLQSGYADKFN